MTATLRKSQSVMTLLLANTVRPDTNRRLSIVTPTMDTKSDAIFVDDTGRKMLTLSWKEWEDFGRPHTMTLTVEPGDTLNDE